MWTNGPGRTLTRHGGGRRKWRKVGTLEINEGMDTYVREWRLSDIIIHCQAKWYSEITVNGFQWKRAKSIEHRTSAWESLLGVDGLPGVRIIGIVTRERCPSRWPNKAYIWAQTVPRPRGWLVLYTLSIHLPSHLERKILQQGYTGNEFSDLGSFFLFKPRGNQLRNQAHFHKKKFTWYDMSASTEAAHAFLLVF